MVPVIKASRQPSANSDVCKKVFGFCRPALQASVAVATGKSVKVVVVQAGSGYAVKLIQHLENSQFVQVFSVEIRPPRNVHLFLQLKQ